MTAAGAAAPQQGCLWPLINKKLLQTGYEHLLDHLSASSPSHPSPSARGSHSTPSIPSVLTWSPTLLWYHQQQNSQEQCLSVNFCYLKVSSVKVYICVSKSERSLSFRLMAKSFTGNAERAQIKCVQGCSVITPLLPPAITKESEEKLGNE